MGYIRTAMVANTALVVMINGIFSNFKQPLLYYLSKGPVGAIHLSRIFSEVVSKLTQIGLIVKTCVTDQGVNFVEWRNRLGITPDNPCVDHEGNRIYFFMILHT